MGTIRILFFLTIFCLGCGSAHAEKRVALVIGNSAYKSVPRLTNPVNDASLVGGMFRKAGFDTVDVKLDLSVVDMRKALREFGSKAREADVAVIYYAGHGIELDGNNYLVPTDAALEPDTEVFDDCGIVQSTVFQISGRFRMTMELKLIEGERLLVDPGPAARCGAGVDQVAVVVPLQIADPILGEKREDRVAEVGVALGDAEAPRPRPPRTPRSTLVRQ